MPTNDRDKKAVQGAVLESVLLPLIFLTVTAAGGFRMTPGGDLRFLPPGLFSLVLAALLLGVLVQGKVLRPAALVLGRATVWEALSGLALLGTLLMGTAQLLGGLLPEQGLLALLFNLFFAVLLSNTIAAEPDARRLLRSLAVTFAWALLMKYVVLAALDTPGPGLTAWLLRGLVHGVSLGGLILDSWSPVVGYVVFGAALLYWVGLWLLTQLPGGDAPPDPTPTRELGA